MVKERADCGHLACENLEKGIDSELAKSKPNIQVPPNCEPSWLLSVQWTEPKPGSKPLKGFWNSDTNCMAQADYIYIAG